MKDDADEIVQRDQTTLEEGMNEMTHMVNEMHRARTQVSEKPWKGRKQRCPRRRGLNELEPMTSRQTCSPDHRCAKMATRGGEVEVQLRRMA